MSTPIGINSGPTTSTGYTSSATSKKDSTPPKPNSLALGGLKKTVESTTSTVYTQTSAQTLTETAKSLLKSREASQSKSSSSSMSSTVSEESNVCTPPDDLDAWLDTISTPPNTKTPPASSSSSMLASKSSTLSSSQPAKLVLSSASDSVSSGSSASNVVDSSTQSSSPAFFKTIERGIKVADIAELNDAQLHWLLALFTGGNLCQGQTAPLSMSELAKILVKTLNEQFATSNHGVVFPDCGNGIELSVGITRGLMLAIRSDEHAINLRFDSMQNLKERLNRFIVIPGGDKSTLPVTLPPFESYVPNSSSQQPSTPTSSAASDSDFDSSSVSSSSSGVSSHSGKPAASTEPKHINDLKREDIESILRKQIFDATPHRDTALLMDDVLETLQAIKKVWNKPNSCSPSITLPNFDIIGVTFINGTTDKRVVIGNFFNEATFKCDSIDQLIGKLTPAKKVDQAPLVSAPPLVSEASEKLSLSQKIRNFFG